MRLDDPARALGLVVVWSGPVLFVVFGVMAMLRTPPPPPPPPDLGPLWRALLSTVAPAGAPSTEPSAIVPPTSGPAPWGSRESD